MGCKSSDVVRFDLGSLLQGQMRIGKLKSAYNLLIIGPRGFQCETNLQEIMGCKSCGVFGFDLGPLLQGQTRIAKLKSAYNLHIIGPRGLQFKPTYRKSWAANLLMWPDLTLGLSLKVKRG